MEQKRFIIFIVASMAILLGWQSLIAPKFFPPPPAAAVAKKPANDKAAPRAKAEKAEAGKADAEKPVADKGRAPEVEPVAPAEKGDKPAALPAELKPAKHPPKVVELGSIFPESGYRSAVTLTTRGAAVDKILLNDPRYVELESKPLPNKRKAHPPLSVVGNGLPPAYTLQTTVPQFGADLNRWDWEVVEVAPARPPHSKAVFRMKSPDGDLEVLKTYELKPVDPQAQPSEGPAYQLHLAITLLNHGEEARTVNYELQGPVGLPLENVDNTSKFRDVVVGFLDEDGSARHKLMTGKVIADGKGEQWKDRLKYIGVDVQFFAVLLEPLGDQIKTPSVKSATQVVVGPNLAEKSDVSVVLTSVDLILPPAGADGAAGPVTHEYQLYAGPKRDDLLAFVGAPKVIDYGYFHWISRPMLSLLKTFYALFGSFGIAIICLTVVVRGCMFPISIKQARGAAKMQEIQPEIAALKEKFGKDKEKLGRAQMELFSKHNYNPFGGCLLVFLQLPVFMGLYNALNTAVDLRMAPFLWAENLAAPDALVALPFRIPFVGWNQLNVLPLVTMVLFLFQQKMFMPPAMNDEQAMQQKMMSWMTIFMGFMFYKVPAGLCVYFIASSLWGLGERKLLPKAKLAKPSTPPPAPTLGGGPPFGAGPSRRGPEDDSGGGLFSKLMKAAEKEVSARKTAQQGRRK